MLWNIPDSAAEFHILGIPTIIYRQKKFIDFFCRLKILKFVVKIAILNRVDWAKMCLWQNNLIIYKWIFLSTITLATTTVSTTTSTTTTTTLAPFVPYSCVSGSNDAACNTVVFSGNYTSYITMTGCYDYCRTFGITTYPYFGVQTCNPG